MVGGPNLISESVRIVMELSIEAEANEQIGAGRYQRTETRVRDRDDSGGGWLRLRPAISSCGSRSSVRVSSA